MQSRVEGTCFEFHLGKQKKRIHREETHQHDHMWVFYGFMGEKYPLPTNLLSPAQQDSLP